MNAWLKRLGMSLFVTLSFMAHRLPAQAPLVPLSQPIDLTPSTPFGALVARPDGPQMSRHPNVNNKGYCCASSINWYGCGGLRAQWDFVFGSCRTFMGEPCVARQPGQFHKKAE